MTKVVLAYSGSLDGLICIHWLQQVKGWRVIVFMAQIGQPAYFEPIADKALQLGTSTVFVSDLRERFVRDYIWQAFKAQARYEKGYLLSAALSRPLIVEELVRIAHEEGCTIVAHGARGLGNDYIRFENCLRDLDPDLEVITPIRELDLHSVKEDMDYAQKHQLPISSIKHTLYNVDYNLWGVNIQLAPHQAGDFWKELPNDTYIMTTPIQETPDKPTVLELRFKKGISARIDNKTYSPVELIELLNKVGGRHAVGRMDVVEDKISGAKSREIYESPAASVLYAAHHALESIIFDKQTQCFYEIASNKYGELVYDGNWFNPLRKSLDKFFDQLEQRMNGVVRLSLFKGNITILGRKSL